MDTSYTLYWKKGKREILKGTTINDALRRGGYTPQEKSKIELFFKGVRNDYKFFKGKWVKVEK
jgi:hypothetical protein